MRIVIMTVLIFLLNILFLLIPSTFDDIYMFNKGTAEQKAAAFMYIKYLLGKNQQLTWADQTGYIPVTNNVINSSAYKDSTKSKVPDIATFWLEKSPER